MKHMDLPSTMNAPLGARITLQHTSERVSVFAAGTAFIIEPGTRATFELHEVERDDFGGLAPRRERVWSLTRYVRLKKKVAPVSKV